jgi:hypothetical protein
MARRTVDVAIHNRGARKTVCRLNNRISLRKVGSVACLAIMTSLGMPNPSHAQQSQVIQPSPLLTHHVRDVVAKGQVKEVGPLPLDQHLQLAIVLPLRNQPLMDTFLKEVYDPKGPHYRKFLTVQQFTDSFGATQADYDALVEYAKANGMTVKGTHPNRLVLSVDASASAINKAFNVTMGVYQHPTENRTFYSPDREPSVNLGVKLWHIAGLDNFSIPRRASGTGSSPGGGFTNSDMRAAYGVAGLTGARQSIALVGGTFRIEDVRAYFETFGQPFHAGAIQTISVDGFDTSCALGDNCGELALDVEQALSMAPGVDSVIVYAASNATAAFSRMAADNIAKQMSVSFGWWPVDPNPDEPIFQEFVAQGQTLFAASGDQASYVASACTSNGANCSYYPAEHPYVTAVGGTSLTTTGPGGAWVSEVAWGGSGGGISTHPTSTGVPSYQIPSYQTLSGVINASNQGSTTLRNLPDVAAYADFNNYVCANGSCGTGVSGTSFASPRWAGIMALINQQAVNNGYTAGVGQLNPAIYAIGVGNNYTNDFHDITQGNNFNPNVNPPQNLYPAVRGYDLVTGWGSPQVQNLANDLIGISACWPAYVAEITFPVPWGSISFPNTYPAGSEVSLNGENYTAATATSLSPSGNAGPSGSGQPWITPAVNAAGYALCGGLPPPVNRGSPLGPYLYFPTYVNLTSYFNGTGIYLDNQTYRSNGVDTNGNAYSRTLLGTIQNASWRTMIGKIPNVENASFSISNAPMYNLVRAAGQTITLPSGTYNRVWILATGVNGAQTSQTFTVLYADGTAAPFTQNLSNWQTSSYYDGESVAVTMPYNNTSAGQTVNTPVNLYGYEFAPDATKTTTGIQLPNNSNVAVFAITTCFCL